MAANFTVVTGGRSGGSQFTRRRARNLRVIEGGLTLDGHEEFDPRQPKTKDQLDHAFDTVHAVLDCENWFFDKIRTMIAVKTGGNREQFKVLGAKEGHDSLLHLAQFFFFLEALDCTTPDAVLAFIKAHNTKVAQQLEQGGQRSSPSELRRTIFKARRITNVQQTVDYYNKPVFAKREIGDLLFDIMSPRKTEELIDELLQGGILLRRGDGVTEDPPPAADPSRVLVEPHPFFVNCYIESLLRLRRAVGGCPAA